MKILVTAYKDSHKKLYDFCKPILVVPSLFAESIIKEELERQKATPTYIQCEKKNIGYSSLRIREEVYNQFKGLCEYKGYAMCQALSALIEKKLNEYK